MSVHAGRQGGCNIPKQAELESDMATSEKYKGCRPVGRRSAWDFPDLPFLAKELGLAKDLPRELESLLGSIDGERALEVVRAYMTSFFGFAVGQRS